MAESDTTGLIEAIAAGDGDAYKVLFARVYGDLRRLAHRQLRGAGAASTIDTTELVHEVYLKLANPESLDLANRAHFFALAARAMRQVVMDHARQLASAKRGGNVRPVSLDDAYQLPSPRIAPEQLLAIDQGLERMMTAQPGLASLIELRFFAGLEMRQIAEMRQVSERTLARQWRRARAELCAALEN